MKLSNIFKIFKRKRPEHPVIHSPKSFNKIFGIGYPKTGTTSLSVALEGLGFKMFHDAETFFPNAIMTGDLSIAEEDEWDGTCNIFQNYFVNMDKQYPNSKFILTTRDMRKWFESLESWRPQSEINQLRKYDINNIIDLFNEKEEPRLLAILLSYFARYGCISMDKAMYIQKHQEHCDRVTEHFKDRPEQLLVLNVATNNKYQKICEFLEQPLPKHKYPHEKKVSHRYIE